jgi:hypothetical protein
MDLRERALLKRMRVAEMRGALSFPSMYRLVVDDVC